MDNETGTVLINLLKHRRDTVFVSLWFNIVHNSSLYYQLLAETSQEQVLALFVRLLLTVILSLTLY